MPNVFCPRCGHRVERAEMDLTADKPGKVDPVLHPCGHQCQPVKLDPVAASSDTLAERLAQLRVRLIRSMGTPSENIVVPRDALVTIVDRAQHDLDARKVVPAAPEPVGS